MSRWIRISLCDVPGMLDYAMEVETRRGGLGRGASYYVGRDEQHGETVVRPVDSRGEAIGPEWQVDGSVLDALELIQAGAGCDSCGEAGKVEDVGDDPADVREVDCEECDGKGWAER